LKRVGRDVDPLRTNRILVESASGRRSALTVQRGSIPQKRLELAGVLG
jgi:hypothetical protein